MGKGEGLANYSLLSYSGAILWCPGIQVMLTLGSRKRSYQKERQLSVVREESYQFSVLSCQFSVGRKDSFQLSVFSSQLSVFSSWRSASSSARVVR